MHVSYPTAEQIAAARQRGVSPGGDITQVETHAAKLLKITPEF